MKTINEENQFHSLTNVQVGENVKIFKFVNAYGCKIGSNSKIGAFVEIQKGVSIGENCKISSHTFICEGVEIDDNVFIGHNVTFINDRFPRSVTPNGKLQTEADWKLETTTIGKGVSIGSSCTILCGISIGDNALIGAGSVVTKNIPANAVAYGNPAQLKHKI